MAKHTRKRSSHRKSLSRHRKSSYRHKKSSSRRRQRGGAGIAFTFSGPLRFQKYMPEYKTYAHLIGADPELVGNTYRLLDFRNHKLATFTQAQIDALGSVASVRDLRSGTHYLSFSDPLKFDHTGRIGYEYRLLTPAGETRESFNQAQIEDFRSLASSASNI